LFERISQVNFTPARFNVGDGITEDWIVTSTGPYIITWNFRKIRQGRKPDYKVCFVETFCMQVYVLDVILF
jgi:hypothetical protein